MTEILGLPDKDFKAVIVKIFQQVNINMPETNENIESFCKDVEHTKKNQIKILELKNMITENKNLKG